MGLKDKAYREIVGKMGFDINAGQSINPSLTLKELTDDIVKYIDDGNKGCCFHASVYLSKLLHDNGINSEIILTVEPTVLENGETRQDLRASIMLKDDGKWIVMNPIEDVEFFEKNNISSESRDNYYEGDATKLIGSKDDVFSFDAGNIELGDFITRYGNGSAWTIGSMYCDGYENKTFEQARNGARFIKIDEYTQGENQI